MKRDKSGIIKSLDFRTPIEQGLRKCKKCNNNFLFEMREGNNKKPDMCNECLNNEFEERDILKFSCPNIPKSFIKESFEERKFIHKHIWDELK